MIQAAGPPLCHRFDRETGERCEPGEQLLLAIAQQFIAPVNGVPQSLLANRQVTRSAPKQLQPAPLRRSSSALRREQPDPGRGELDGKGQAIQAEADLSDGRHAVVVRQLKVRLHRLGALDKQPYSLTLGKLFDGQRFEIGPG